MKILLVNQLHSKNIKIQLGTLSLATILKQADYDVEVIDFNTLYSFNGITFARDGAENVQNLADYIMNKNPQIIGFSCICSCYHIYIKMAQYIKEKNGDIKIVFGGPQASLTAKETLTAFPWIDLVALGEAEKIIIDIMKAIEYGQGFEAIPGIAFRKGSDIIINPKKDLIENLDELPFLDYEFIPVFKKLSHAEIEVGRGCPFNCAYCSTKTFWERRFRLKSIDRLIKEIKYLYENYHIRSFSFIHDLFTANRKYILAFCDRLQLEGLDILWGCSARPDTIDEEMIQKMKGTGCESIFLGIETGSKRMQKLVKKNLNLDEIDGKVDLLNKYRITTTLSFIYGFPEETLEDLKDTLAVIENLRNRGNEIIQLHKCGLFAGTELYERYQGKLIFNDNPPDIAGYLDLAYYKDIIFDHEAIFPHYFITEESKTLVQYNNLDKFMGYYYRFFKVSICQTYRLLIEHYQGDILFFYQELEKFNPEIYNQISTFASSMHKSNRGHLAKNELDYANIIASFIFESDFGKYTGVIQEIFKYEYDVIRYKYEPKDDNLHYYHYDYDVIAIEQNNLRLAEIVASPVSLSFRNENNNLIIERVSSDVHGDNSK